MQLAGTELYTLLAAGRRNMQKHSLVHWIRAVGVSWKRWNIYNVLLLIVCKMSHSSAACYFLAVHSSFLIVMWLRSHPLMFILRADEDTLVKLLKVLLTKTSCNIQNHCSLLQSVFLNIYLSAQQKLKVKKGNCSLYKVCVFFAGSDIFWFIDGVVVYRCAVELVLMRCSEDAHNSWCSVSANQHSHYSSLGLGHLAPPGRPQAAHAFLTGPPQRYWVPQVQFLINVNPSLYSTSIVFHCSFIFMYRQNITLKNLLLVLILP